MGKRTVFVATLLTSFLAIGALPALADRPHRGGFGGGVEKNRLEVLSHRLEGRVRHLEHQAKRCIGHRSRREHKALGALHRLGIHAAPGGGDLHPGVAPALQPGQDLHVRRR